MRTSCSSRRAWISLAWLALPLAACFDMSNVGANLPITSQVTDWRDEIIYQLMVDRFADGDLNNDVNINPSALGRFQGGDWQGVIDHVDYLQALGVTAVWISPAVRNLETDANFDSYHGYWQQDFEQTNPHMGDLAKLREMVQTLHQHNIKVILDIVTNHIAQLFFYDINKNGVPDEEVYGSGSTQDSNGALQSPVEHLTEYDPDFDPNGVQAYTSLGFSGLAPIRWIYNPAINRLPPEPSEFKNTDWYNGKGRVTVWTDPSACGCQSWGCPVCSRPNSCSSSDQVLYDCLRNQELTGDFPGGLKDLKTLNPDVQAALIRVFSEWIDRIDIDGFRIDTLKHVEHEFWQAFCPAIRLHAKAIGKKNFFMFGEAFDGDDALVGSYTFNDEVDSTFFFPQKFAVVDRVFKASGPTNQITAQLSALATYYSTTPNTDGPVGADGTPLTTQQLMVNFLDNHDVPRFLYDKPSVAALHNALAFIFTEIGVPCVYYGTEQEFFGGNDPANRERLWDTGFNTAGDTFQWVHTLTNLRKNYRPLRRGSLHVAFDTGHTGTESDAGLFAFERIDGDKSALVVLNVSDTQTSSTPSMAVGFAPGTELVDVLGSGDTVTVAPDGSVVITVPARGQKVFVASADSGGIP